MFYNNGMDKRVVKIVKTPFIMQVEYQPVFVRLGRRYACDAFGQPIIFANKVHALHTLVLGGLQPKLAEFLEFETAICSSAEKINFQVTRRIPK